MGGSLGGVLVAYVFPLVGLGLLLLGGWCTWGMWVPAATRPPLAVRAAAVSAGLVLASLLMAAAVPAGPGQVALGLPMPYLTLGVEGGPALGLGGPGALACAALDLAVGVGLGHLAVRGVHKWWLRRAGRRWFRRGRELEDLSERVGEGR